jgi:hypothetical protein
MRVAHARFYKFEDARHKAVATTTGPGWENLREEFVMNWMMPGGFSSGPIFGLDGQLRFQSLEKNDALLHKIIYRYDSAGNQTGYAIFDASGKLIDRTSASLPSASVSP